MWSDDGTDEDFTNFEAINETVNSTQGLELAVHAAEIQLETIHTLGQRHHLAPLRDSCPELHVELTLERLRDAEQRVDPRRAPSTFEARDRRLRRVAQGREVGLREPELATPFGDLRRDGGEEPAFVGAREVPTKPFDRRLSASLRSHVCYIALLRYLVKTPRDGGDQASSARFRASASSRVSTSSSTL